MAGSANNAPLWTPCYVALGSNLDQPIEQVRRAFKLLKGTVATHLIATSSLYESSPMGPVDQPQFVNAAAGLLTQLSPLQMLGELQAIERQMGRAPTTVHWGPRVIDLDLLMQGDVHSDLGHLQLPHPGMLQRNFVMTPLAEIAPALWVSRTQTVVQVAHQLGSAGLQRLPDQGEA